MGQPCLEKPLQNEPSSASAFALWHHQLTHSQFIKVKFLLISYAVKVISVQEYILIHSDFCSRAGVDWE